MKPSKWEILSKKTIGSYPVFSIQERVCQHPIRKTKANFYIAEGFDWALAIAETPDGKLIFINQYRFGIDDFSWEFPAGCIEKGEDPVHAAQRELLEETGYKGCEALLLGQCKPNPALQNNTCYFVFIKGAIPSIEGTNWDPVEEIEVSTNSIEEIEQMIDRGDAPHSINYAAIYYYNKHKKNSKI